MEKTTFRGSILGGIQQEEILKCHQAGIEGMVPKPTTSNAKAECRFDKADFVHIAKDDEMILPPPVFQDTV